MQIRKQDGAPEPDCALEALCVLLLLYDFLFYLQLYSLGSKLQHSSNTLDVLVARSWYRERGNSEYCTSSVA